jgi:ATP-dependent Lhr-like helicase
MTIQEFHPAVRDWFDARFGGATAVQRGAWPAILAGHHALLAAPTGSGKTLAAFLAAIDALVREATAGTLGDEVRVLYVSPLKALSNDIHQNLERPWPASARRGSCSRSSIRSRGAHRRHAAGGARPHARKQPPHILVTTPESLYILLTSESGRRCWLACAP